jgi:hypothetical protein
LNETYNKFNVLKMKLNKNIFKINITKEINMKINIEGLNHYDISENGKSITNINTSEEMYIFTYTISKKNLGYQQCKLYNTKYNTTYNYYIHRLMGATYISNDDIETKTQVHHIDLNRSNNNKSNLMWVSRKTNLDNKGNYTNNKTGFKGVFKLSENKYRASIRINNKLKHLGIFSSAEAAFDVYINYKKNYTEYIC